MDSEYRPDLPARQMRSSALQSLQRLARASGFPLHDAAHAAKIASGHRTVECLSGVRTPVKPPFLHGDPVPRGHPPPLPRARPREHRGGLVRFRDAIRLPGTSSLDKACRLAAAMPGIWRGTVLDLRCRAGSSSRRSLWDARSFHTLGLDLHPAPDIVADLNKRISLPDDGSADVVVALDVLEHPPTRSTPDSPSYAVSRSHVLDNAAKRVRAGRARLRHLRGRAMNGTYCPRLPKSNRPRIGTGGSSAQRRAPILSTSGQPRLLAGDQRDHSRRPASSSHRVARAAGRTCSFRRAAVHLARGEDCAPWAGVMRRRARRLSPPSGTE